MTVFPIPISSISSYTRPTSTTHINYPHQLPKLNNDFQQLTVTGDSLTTQATNAVVQSFIAHLLYCLNPLLGWCAGTRHLFNLGCLRLCDVSLAGINGLKLVHQGVIQHDMFLKGERFEISRGETFEISLSRAAMVIITDGCHYLPDSKEQKQSINQISGETNHSSRVPALAQ